MSVILLCHLPFTHHHPFTLCIVDGAMGGTFLRRVGDYLEQFDVKRGV